MREIYIFGAGNNGKTVLDMLKKHKMYGVEFRVEGICDLYKTGESFFDYIITGPECIPLSSVVILAITDEKSMIDMYDAVYVLGIREIFWFSGNKRIDNDDYFFNIQCVDCRQWGETVIRHIEINLADHCNLNCKCCSHFSALFEPRYISVEELLYDLEQIKMKFTHVLNLYLMGGEPLLNKNLSEIIVQSRKALIDTRIVIVTNGILIPRLDGSVLNTIRENNVHIDISEYIPTHKLMPQIQEKLSEYGVSYHIKEMKSDNFYKLLSVSKNSIYPKGCLADGCYDVWQGKIARCPMLMYIYRFNDVFGTNLPQEGIYDLNSDVSGGELRQLLKEKVPLCNHCITRKVDWGQCGQEITLADFAERE